MSGREEARFGVLELAWTSLETGCLGVRRGIYDMDLGLVPLGFWDVVDLICVSLEKDGKSGEPGGLRGVGEQGGKLWLW